MAYQLKLGPVQLLRGPTYGIGEVWIRIAARAMVRGQGQGHNRV